MHTWYTAGARSTAAPCESTTVPSLRSDAAAALNAWKGRGVSAQYEGRDETCPVSTGKRGGGETDVRRIGDDVP